MCFWPSVKYPQKTGKAYKILLRTIALHTESIADMSLPCLWLQVTTLDSTCCEKFRSCLKFTPKSFATATRPTLSITDSNKSYETFGLWKTTSTVLSRFTVVLFSTAQFITNGLTGSVAKRSRLLRESRLLPPLQWKRTVKLRLAYSSIFRNDRWQLSTRYNNSLLIVFLLSLGLFLRNVLL